MLRTRAIVSLWYLCYDLFGAQHCFFCELQHLTQMHWDFLTNDVIKILTNQGCHISKIGHVLHFNNTNKIKQDPQFYITLNLDKGWVMEMHLITFGNVIMWVSIDSKQLPIKCKILQQSKTSCETSKPNIFPNLLSKSSKEWQYVSQA